MSTHASVFHCPYCGEENLFPHEGDGGGWECRSCRRAFSVSFHGLLGSKSDRS